MNSDPRSPRSLFLEAVETVPPNRWGHFLDVECGKDAELRQQVLRLLNAHRESGEFLASPVAGVGAALAETIVRPPPVDAPLLGVGARIGPYKLLEQIGEGGMGVVYVAEQTEPIRRRVALKVIKPGMDSRQVIARFEAERQALAMMDHPHIARVLDAGMSEAGLPYFVMELVRGMPITEYCDKAKLTPEQRVELFVAVCQAVQHAHQKGIIHRDLKPSNVLVTLHDGKPIPKVIDFGVAKAIGQQLTENTIYTGFTQLIGTPLYMSPEQAELSGLDIDTRSDVYSLGVLLYELLTGHTPFDSGTLIRCGLDEMRRLLREVEPPRPSHRVSTLKADALSTTSANRGLDQRQLTQTLHGELDWIVMKAMEKERDRRYESASGLAADLQRYLDDEPVLACPPSMGYQLSKIVRRHRGILTGTTLVLIALLIGTAVSVWYAFVADRAKQEAVGANQLADKRRVSAEKSAAEARFQARQARQFEAEAREERDRTARTLYDSDIRLAHSDLRARNASRAADVLMRHFPYPGELDRRGWEWHYLLGQAHNAVRTVLAHQSAIYAVAWSPDGTLVASVSGDGSARIWDTGTWTQLRHLPQGKTLKKGVQWSPDSQYLAWGSAEDDGALRIWNRQTDAVTEHPGHKSSIWAVAWSHDGQRIATAGMGSDNLRIWNVADGYSHKVLAGAAHYLEAVSWSSDDTLLAATGSGGPLTIWDPASGEVLLTEPIAQICGSKWHPTEPLIALGTVEGECLVWDQATRSIVRGWAAHVGAVAAVAWSPDANQLASVGADGTVKSWNATTGAEIQTCSGHRGRATSVAWSPHGNQFLSGGYDMTLRVWDSQPKPASTVINTGQTGSQVMIWVDNETLRSMHDNSHQVFDWSAVEGRLIRKRELPNGHRFQLMSPRLAMELTSVAEGDALLNVWSIDPMQKAGQFPVAGFYVDAEGDVSFRAAVSHDDTRLLMAPKHNGRAVLTDLRNGNQHQTAQHLAGQFRAQWAPNGQFAASVGHGLDQENGAPKFHGYIHLIDGHSGQYLKRFRVGDQRIGATALAWSPDSTKVAAGNADGLCEVFDVASGRTLVSRRFHNTLVRSMSWSPDGRRVVSGADGHDLRLWDAGTGAELLVLERHDGAVLSAAWSPDGRKLASLSRAGQIRVWETSAGFNLVKSAAWDSMLDEVEWETVNALAQREEWQEAERQCVRFLSRHRDSPVILQYMAAVLSCAAGDVSRYRTHCRQILEAGSSTRETGLIARAVWTCAVAPRGLNDYAQAVEQERRLNTMVPGEFPLERGAILLRAGRLPEAREHLLRVAQPEAGATASRAYAMFLLAITSKRLSHVADARMWLDRAQKQAELELSDPGMFRFWPRRLTLQLLRDEATALIAPAATSKPVAKETAKPAGT